VLLLFTDGVTEAMNEKRQLYGEERLRQTLARLAPLDAQAIVDGIVKDVWGYMTKQRDDVTLVVAKRLGSPASA
jgi:serine phosphatase RsbU (regulator of sigma subunit)